VYEQSKNGKSRKIVQQGRMVNPAQKSSKQAMGSSGASKISRQTSRDVRNPAPGETLEGKKVSLTNRFEREIRYLRKGKLPPKEKKKKTHTKKNGGLRSEIEREQLQRGCSHQEEKRGAGGDSHWGRVFDHNDLWSRVKKKKQKKNNPRFSCFQGKTGKYNQHSLGPTTSLGGQSIRRSRLSALGREGWPYAFHLTQPGKRGEGERFSILVPRSEYKSSHT